MSILWEVFSILFGFEHFGIHEEDRVQNFYNRNTEVFLTTRLLLCYSVNQFKKFECVCVHGSHNKA